MKTLLCGSAAVLFGGAAAMAGPVLQFDLNAFSAQAQNGNGVGSPFGGVNHTGSVNFSLGQGVLVGMFSGPTLGGQMGNLNFNGTLTGFSGQINLTNGQVTGGSITVTISGGDTYTTQVTPNSGHVSTFVGGGFKIEALTRAGFFNDAQFGNVNVSPWFNSQGTGGLFGSLLQFNFSPNAQGFASSDMDLFVDVVPLPAGAWAGLATLAVSVVIRRASRRS